MSFNPFALTIHNFWMIQIPHISSLCCVVIALKVVGFEVIFGRLHHPAPNCFVLLVVCPVLRICPGDSLLGLSQDLLTF